MGARQHIYCRLTLEFMKHYYDYGFYYNFFVGPKFDAVFDFTSQLPDAAAVVVAGKI